MSESQQKPIEHISAFDLDHTLFVGNSGFRFGLYLYRKNLYSFFHLFATFVVYALVYMGLLPLSKLHEVGFKYLFKGKSEEVLKKWLDDFLSEDFEAHLYKPALEKLQAAQRENHLTVILSNSPNFVVSAIAKKLGVTHWRSTQYALDKERRFCHILHVMQGEDKARSIEELCRQNGLKTSAVTAYSDSHLDLPFMMIAGTAVGVNPDRKLRAICKKNHWPII